MGSAYRAAVGLVVVGGCTGVGVALWALVAPGEEQRKEMAKVSPGYGGGATGVGALQVWGTKDHQPPGAKRGSAMSRLAPVSFFHPAFAMLRSAFANLPASFFLGN